MGLIISFNTEVWGTVLERKEKEGGGDTPYTKNGLETGRGYRRGQQGGLRDRVAHKRQ